MLSAFSSESCPSWPGLRSHSLEAVQATGRRIAEAIADVLAVGKKFASMRCAHLAQSLPTISGPHAVGSLERQHPSWILKGKGADLIQLPKLVLCECEFDRREIV